MAQVQIISWRRDANKTGADKAVAEIAGMDLSEAKQALDRVLKGEVVVIPVANDEVADALWETLRSFNFDARVT